MVDTQFQNSRRLTLLIILLLLAACNQPPPPPTAVARCNPVPIPPPALPAMVESITYQGPELYGPVHSLHVEGDRMYMGLGNNFAVMDVSNAAEPRLLGTVSLPRSAFSGMDIYAVRDDLVYLGIGSPGLSGAAELVIDVTNPAEPVIVECNPAVPKPRLNTFNGRYEIYSGGSGGITIHQQTTNGSKGQEIASFAIYPAPRIEWNQPPGQQIPLPSITRPKAMSASDFTFDDRYLYLISVEYIPGQYCCGRLTILDLENPADPDHISTTVFPSNTVLQSVKAVGDFLFVTNHGLPDSAHTIVFDMTDKRKLVELGTIPTLYPFQVHNRYAYFPDWTKSEIAIWDLQDEDSPKLVGKINAPDSLGVFSRSLENNLAFVGDYIYLANGGTLEILDNQDPANPYFVNRVEYPLLPVPNQIAVSDSQVAAAIIRRGGREIQILEIEPGGQLGEWQPLSVVNMIEPIAEFTIHDGYIYTLDIAVEEEIATTNLNVFDLAGPTQNSPAAALSLNNYATYLMAAAPPNLFLFDARNNPKIAVIDVSEPLNPSVAAEITLEPGDYSHLAVWKDDLYILSGYPDTKLLHFDISSPVHPQFTQFYELPPQLQIAAGDGYLFGIGVNHNVEVFELRPSDNPVLVEQIPIVQGNARDIIYENGTLYLAVGVRGLAAVQLNLDD